MALPCFRHLLTLPLFALLVLALMCLSYKQYGFMPANRDALLF